MEEVLVASDITDEQQNQFGKYPRRRDICKFSRDIYEKIFNLIRNKGTLPEAIDLLIDAINDLCSGRVSYKDLAMKRKVLAMYHSDTSPMKIFIEELRKTGKTINPGDIVEYVIVESVPKKNIGYRMRLIEDFGGGSEPIDYKFYINVILRSKIDRLFSVGFKDAVSHMKHIYYRGKYKIIFLDQPVALIMKAIESGHDPTILKQMVQLP